MAVTLPKSPEEIQQMPLVELAWWILKAYKNLTAPTNSIRAVE